MKKKTIWCFGLISALLFSAYAFRDFLTATALEMALNRLAGKAIAYEERSWEDGKLVYQGFSLGDQVRAEHASFEFDLHGLSLDTKIHLVSPVISLNETSPHPSSLAFLIPTQFWTTKLDIEEGQLSGLDGALYSFDFASGDDQNDIGTLSFYHDEATPLLSCKFKISRRQLAIDLRMEDAPLEKTAAIASLFYPLQPWKTLDGTATAAIKGMVDQHACSFLQGHLALNNVRWESEGLIFAIDAAASEIDFQGEIETLALNSHFNGADLFWKELEVLRGQGSVVFIPQEMPAIEAHAHVNIGGIEGQADLAGRGEIHADKALWLEGAFNYSTADPSSLKVDFSFVDNGASQVLQTDVHNLSKEILALLAKPFLPWKIEQGTLEGKFTTFFSREASPRLQIDDLHLRDAAFEHLFIPHLEGQGSLDLATNNIEQMSLQIKDAKAVYPHWKATNLKAALAIQNNSFQPSVITGMWEGLPIEIDLRGPIASLHATARCSATASEWLHLPSNTSEPMIAVELACDRHFDKLQIKGTVSCLEDVVHVAAEAPLSMGTIKGGFLAPSIQSASYTPFLKLFAPDLTLRGKVSLHGQFSHESIDLIAKGQDLSLALPDLQISIPGPSKEVAYHYNFDRKQGAGRGQLSPLVITTSKLPLEVSVTEGDFLFDAASFVCSNLAGHVGGVDMSGELTLYWNATMEANFLAQRVEGSLQNLSTLASYFISVPSFVGELQGRFASPSEGFQVHWEPDTMHYRFEASLQEIAGAITPQWNLEKTSCHLAYDTLDDQLLLSQVQGILAVHSKEGMERIGFTAGRIGHKHIAWSFDAAFSQEAEQLLSVQGQAVETTNGYEIVLKEAKASDSYLQSPLSFHWTPPGQIDHLQGVVYLKTDTLAQQLTLAHRLGLFDLNPSVKETLEQLQGSMTLRFILQNERSEWEAQGLEMRYGSFVVHSADAHLVQEGSEWILKRCLLDDVQMTACAAYQNDKWVVPSWDIRSAELALHTAGVYERGEFNFHLEGQLVPGLALKGDGVFVSSAPHFQNIHLQLQAKSEQLQLKCEKLSYQDGKWESPSVDTAVFSDHLAHPIRAELLLSVSRAATTFQGVISQGDAFIGKSQLKPTQIFGLYEARCLNLKCLAAFDDEPLEFIGKFFKDHQWSGGMSVQSGSETLKISLSNPTTWQRIEGELFGVRLDLQREVQGFTQGFKGAATIKDGSKIADLLDKEFLRDFNGLQFQGEWSKLENEWAFKGELEGQDVCLQDYCIQGVHASVDYTPTHFRCKNIILQDLAGSFVIKECIGNRLTSHDKWSISIPLLKGQEIKPSALRKRGAAPEEAKPLLIRHFVMTDLTGQWGDLSSFQGQGSFNFTQRVKKEPSVFDIPVAMLKDLGLDLDLFTPVMGEVRLQLSDGKLLLTHLQNTFSEGKRSEFYLAAEPSFIDLQGRLSLNLRMQQNVILKLVEPFMIAVRGTWEKPKYSLQ